LKNKYSIPEIFVNSSSLKVGNYKKNFAEKNLQQLFYPFFVLVLKSFSFKSAKFYRAGDFHHMKKWEVYNSGFIVIQQITRYGFISRIKILKSISVFF